MPGSSLWLIPPSSHPLHAKITDLITTILPSQFPEIASSSGPNGDQPVPFAPHMTLTSEIPPSIYGGTVIPREASSDFRPSSSSPAAQLPPLSQEEKDKAQMWLDSIPFPSADETDVQLLSVASQEIFFRRCFIQVGFEGVKNVVAVAREFGVTRSSSAELNTGGVGGSDDATVSEATEEWIKSWKEAYGPHVSLIYGAVPITSDKLTQISTTVEKSGVPLARGESGNSSSWKGGVVWLVPTDRPIEQWKPIATRTL